MLCTNSDAPIPGSKLFPKPYRSVRMGLIEKLIILADSWDRTLHAGISLDQNQSRRTLFHVSSDESVQSHRITFDESNIRDSVNSNDGNIPYVGCFCINLCMITRTRTRTCILLDSYCFTALRLFTFIYFDYIFNDWLLYYWSQFAISADAISSCRTDTVALFWKLVETLYWILYRISDSPSNWHSPTMSPHRTPKRSCSLRMCDTMTATDWAQRTVPTISQT